MRDNQPLGQDWFLVPEWKQLPFVCRCWVNWCRYGPKRRNGLSIGGTLAFRLLRRWLMCFSASDDNILVLKAFRDQLLWTVDLLDLETYVHTVPLLSKGSFNLQMFQSLVESGMTIVDIGANAGLYTFAAAEMTGPTGSVYAFEPQPRLIRMLDTTRRLRNYSWVQTFNMALSDYQGQAAFASSLLFSGVGRLLNRAADKGEKTTMTVSVDRLDSVCDANSIQRVDIVKLDVEGQELSVLSGAVRLLERQHPMIWMEWNPMAQKNAGITFPGMIGFFEQHGYNGFYEISSEWTCLDRRAAPEKLIDILVTTTEHSKRIKMFIN